MKSQGMSGDTWKARYTKSEDRGTRLWLRSNCEGKFYAVGVAGEVLSAGCYDEYLACSDLRSGQVPDADSRNGELLLP